MATTDAPISNLEYFDSRSLSVVKKKIEKIVYDALDSLGFSGDGVSVERSAHIAHGDYATNAALSRARDIGKSANEIAKDIAESIKKRGGEYIEKIEIAGPGFINIFLSDALICKELENIDAPADILKGERINIEFISANPTGDLHIGHGRGAFYGDILANVFSFAGADVTREYYINNSRDSAQIKELGKTALGEGVQYKTEKLSGMMKDCDFSGMDETAAGFALAEKIQKNNKKFISDKLGIRFDNWYSEDAKLRSSGANEAVLDKLKAFVEKKEGEGDALWLKTSAHGDDEDRVIVRSDGSPSYFISDIAYHEDKFARKYNRVIDIWGADHHGHIKKLHAVGGMLGWPREPEVQPIIFITQMVSLKKDGKIKKMSKRAGTVIGLEDLVDEFCIDVVRWFFAEKALGTHIEFDAELAREQSDKNPVYYVQYSHARISSIMKNIEGLRQRDREVMEILKTQSARLLAVKILELQDVIENIAREYGAHKLTSYAYDLAGAINGFYRDVRVIDNGEYDKGAVFLARSAQKTLERVLLLLGISAPDKM